MQGKVEICYVNPAKLPRLTAEETDALLRRARAGDAAARDELIQGNLRLVLSVIQKFAGRGENADDLFQVGCVGLIKAIDNFDPSHEVRFSTYGVPMIVSMSRKTPAPPFTGENILILELNMNMIVRDDDPIHNRQDNISFFGNAHVFPIVSECFQTMLCIQSIFCDCRALFLRQNQFFLRFQLPFQFLNGVQKNIIASGI